MISIKKLLASGVILASFASCNSSSPTGQNPGGSTTLEQVIGPQVLGEPASFRGAGVIGDSKYLIGGPLAQGRVGDILVQNDKIRVIIQKPRRNSGVTLYGGNILDADLTRKAGESGQDTFGTIFPLLNVSWTPYYQKLEVINADFVAGPVIVRATGVLNVYDYIQAYIIAPFVRIAKGGIQLYFPDRFNDLLDPFQNVKELRDVSTTVVTDYILRQDKNYLIVQTSLYNSGTQPVAFPVGEWLNGPRGLSTFLPKTGFTGDQGLYNPADGVPAVIYPAMSVTGKVSYGYFYDPAPFSKPDGTIYPSDMLTISGMNIVGLGERIVLQGGLLPTAGSSGVRPESTINFKLKPGENKYTRYFVVGTGDVGSVLAGGFDALGIPTSAVQGTVVDALGQPVAKARVIAIDTAVKKPAAMFLTDDQGKFSGSLSTGVDVKSKMFGSGKYSFEVYKEGYVDLSAKWNSSSGIADSLIDQNKAGQCKVTDSAAGRVDCTLGQSGLVQVKLTDDQGNPSPGRIGILGFDPSPYATLPRYDKSGFQPDDSSFLSDIQFQSQLYGYIDVLFLNPTGEITNRANPRVVSSNTFRIEPGNYEICFMRGTEYSMDCQRIDVGAGATVPVNGKIKKVVDTKGYISLDAHVHGINSPDSPFDQYARANYAVAEGLDIIGAADHDVLTDYAPFIRDLGLSNFVTSIVGEEITPLAFGHFIAFPLKFDPNHPTGGAFDYTKKPGFEPGPSRREMLTPEETLTAIDEQNPGEQVLQVNHIFDPLLGNFQLAGLVTTTKFPGVPPLSTYSDPQLFRLPANTNSTGSYSAPYPYGTSKIFTAKFTSMELCVGEDTLENFDRLYNSALPVAFNLLNLGKVSAFTCSSDTHSEVRAPVGIVRNFVASSVDPRDGLGQYSELDPFEIAHNVNQQRVSVSGGPFVLAEVQSTDGSKTAKLGETLNLAGSADQKVNLKIHVESPRWLDWNKIEVFVNADPDPAKDDLSGVWDQSAEAFTTPSPDPEPKKSHIVPKYLMTPTATFTRGEVGPQKLGQVLTADLRSADIILPLTITEDSWVVVFVYGDKKAHSTFPFAPKGVCTQSAAVAPAALLNTFDAQRTNEGSDDQICGVKGFAFTNPIYIDVDGNGFQAKYVRSGQSPLK